MTERKKIPTRKSCGGATFDAHEKEPNESTPSRKKSSARKKTAAKKPSGENQEGAVITAEQMKPAIPDVSRALARNADPSGTKRQSARSSGALRKTASAAAGSCLRRRRCMCVLRRDVCTSSHLFCPACQCRYQGATPAAYGLPRVMNNDRPCVT